jgi:hypothetical protein
MLSWASGDPPLHRPCLAARAATRAAAFAAWRAASAASSRRSSAAPSRSLRRSSACATSGYVIVPDVKCATPNVFLGVLQADLASTLVCLEENV